MAERPPRPIRIAAVTLSEDADLDLSVVFNYTVNAWGQDQAETYAQFLKSEMFDLASNPHKGRPVAERPGLFSHAALWRRAKHGHRIVYEESPDGIFVLRILHTAMNPPAQFG